MEIANVVELKSAGEKDLINLSDHELGVLQYDLAEEMGELRRAGNLDGDSTVEAARRRYNATADEWNRRRGNQPKEDCPEVESKMEWFFKDGTIDRDDENFQWLKTGMFDRGLHTCAFSDQEAFIVMIDQPASSVWQHGLPAALDLIQRRMQFAAHTGDEVDALWLKTLAERHGLLLVEKVTYDAMEKKLFGDKQNVESDLCDDCRGAAYEPDQGEVDSWLYFDAALEDVYGDTPADIFGLGVLAEVSGIAHFNADQFFGVTGVKWVEEIIGKQVERIAAEGTPDLTTRTLEDTFKDGMRRGHAAFDAVHGAVHEYAEKNNIPHVGTD